MYQFQNINFENFCSSHYTGVIVDDWDVSSLFITSKYTRRCLKMPSIILTLTLSIGNNIAAIHLLNAG